MADDLHRDDIVSARDDVIPAHDDVIIAHNGVAIALHHPMAGLQLCQHDLEEAMLASSEWIFYMEGRNPFSQLLKWNLTFKMF